MVKKKKIIKRKVLFYQTLSKYFHQQKGKFHKYLISPIFQAFLTKNLRNENPSCDLDTFLNICAEKVNFKNVDIEQVKSFKVLESPEKPGYISKKDFIFILKKFNENITDKDINDIIKELGSTGDGYINLENLAKEMLVK